jgi:hypothetical protein
LLVTPIKISINDRGINVKMTLHLCCEQLYRILKLGVAIDSCYEF